MAGLSPPPFPPPFSLGLNRQIEGSLKYNTRFCTGQQQCIHPDFDKHPYILSLSFLRAKVWNGEAAIKMIKGGSAAEHARLLHEIKILESCRSTQIVQFLGYSITSDGLLLCMEFMPNGTLFSALGKSPEFQWYNRYNFSKPHISI